MRLAVPDTFCGDLIAAGGRIWETDPCEQALFDIDPATGTTTTIDYAPAFARSETTFHDLLWVAHDADGDPGSEGSLSGGAIDAINPTTGHVGGTITIGGDASWLTAGFGSLWTYDRHAGVVHRIHTNL